MRRQIFADEAGTSFQMNLPVLQFFQQTTGYGHVVEPAEFVLQGRQRTGAKITLRGDIDERQLRLVLSCLAQSK